MFTFPKDSKNISIAFRVAYNASVKEDQKEVFIYHICSTSQKVGHTFYFNKVFFIFIT